MKMLTEQWVLVGRGHHLELLGSLVVSEPAPSGALDGGRLGVDLVLEVLEGSKVLLDLVGENAGRRELGLGRASWGKVLPEQLVSLSAISPRLAQWAKHTEWLLEKQVVRLAHNDTEMQDYAHVSTAVELESRLEGDRALDIVVRDQLVKRLLCSVQPIDVCLVVLGVMESHDLFGDGWLKSLSMCVSSRFHSVRSCHRRRGPTGRSQRVLMGP
jgi:hypothetical protein